MAEALVRALRPTGAQESLDRGTQVLREALALYSPSSLAELYMAVRAKAASVGGGCEPLIDALRCAADREPHLSLTELAARAAV